MIKQICMVLILVCLVLNVMNLTAYTIHSHKLTEINECSYEMGCDYISKWNEYDNWKDYGITSVVWRWFG